MVYGPRSARPSSEIWMLADNDIERMVERLASGPGRFAAAISRLEDADSVTKGRPGEWSAEEVLAHVRASNDILEPRIFYILARAGAPLVEVDERRWAEVAHYAST